MADAIKTMGASIKKTAGTIIANVTDISRSGASGGLMDTTNLSTTNGLKTMETSGVFESGEITVVLNWDPSNTQHKEIVTDWQAGTSAGYTVTFSNADAWIGNLIPTGMDWSNPVADDGKLEATATFKITGSGITDPS